MVIVAYQGRTVKFVNAAMAGLGLTAMVGPPNVPSLSNHYTYTSSVCETDLACSGFPILGLPDLPDDDDGLERNMTCYRGGVPVFSNHQMCDVTSTLLISLI